VRTPQLQQQEDEEISKRKRSPRRPTTQ
jgi:hypothetical protein